MKMVLKITAVLFGIIILLLVAGKIWVTTSDNAIVSSYEADKAGFELTVKNNINNRKYTEVYQKLRELNSAGVDNPAIDKLWEMLRTSQWETTKSTLVDLVVKKDFKSAYEVLKKFEGAEWDDYRKEISSAKLNLQKIENEHIQEVALFKELTTTPGMELWTGKNLPPKLHPIVCKSAILSYYPIKQAGVSNSLIRNIMATNGDGAVKNISLQWDGKNKKCNAKFKIVGSYNGTSYNKQYYGVADGFRVNESGDGIYATYVGNIWSSN